MPRDQQRAQEIETAVGEALGRGEYDEASRLAAGHPDPRKHVAIMERIHKAREGGEVVLTFGGDPTTVAQFDTDLAGTPLDDEPGDFLRFELRARPALLSSFNPRAEKHGDEPRPAADLKFRLNLAADTLDAFDPILRRMFFCKAGTRGDLVDAVHDAPNLRSEKLAGPFKLRNRYAGYTLRVHFGSDDAHVVLADCALNKLEFDPAEGGTCIVTFRLQTHPDAQAAGRLSMLVGATVDITLEPPEGGGEIVGDDDGGTDE